MTNMKWNRVEHRCVLSPGRQVKCAVWGGEHRALGPHSGCHRLPPAISQAPVPLGPRECGREIPEVPLVYLATSCCLGFPAVTCGWRCLFLSPALSLHLLRPVLSSACTL